MTKDKKNEKDFQLDRYKVNLLTLRFSDSEIEGEFFEDYYNKTIRHLRNAVLLGSFLYAIFGVLDAWIIPEVKAKAWFIRYAVVCPFSIAFYLFSFSPRFKRIMQESIAFIILIAGLGLILISLIAGSGEYLYDAGLILVTMYAYTFINLRFVYATFISWALAITYAIITLWKGNPEPLFLLSNIFLLVSANIIGMFAGYTMELHSRRNFMQMQVNARTLNRLKDEITAHELAEAAERETNEKLRAVLQASPAAIMTLNPAGIITLWNKAAERVFGWEREEIIGKFNPMVPEDKIGEFNALRERVLRGESFFGMEVRRQRKDGSPVDISLSTAPMHDIKGEVDGIMAVISDITERKKAEEKINFLVSIVQAIPEAVCSIDLDGKIISWNEGAEKMLGYTNEEIIGRPITTIIPENLARHELEHCIGILNAEGSFTGYESVRITKNGRSIPVEITAVALRDKGRNIISYASIMRDITERKKMEEDLIKSEKLESLGILAGGIAHDFNNLLTAILGNISLSKMYAKSDRNTYERLTEAEKALFRARDLTQQLLTFSKGGEPVKKVVSITGLIKDSTDFALGGSNVKAEFLIPDDLWVVEADEGQVSQVIHNMVINADQSMPRGGTLRVSCSNIDADTDSAAPLRDRKYVKISIEDQGVGIPQDYLQKIFDPYFTTKQKGSGLGLATAYSIIKKHDGHITVDSIPGAGTTFSIYLPASTEKIPGDSGSGKRLFTGKGKVLVMDDEEIIRLILEKMLSEIGYEAGFAEDGEQAVKIYETAMSSGQPFDAALIDLTVRGGMGGIECVRKLQLIDPSVKAIVSSGYADDPAISNYRDFGFRGIITKPYQIEDLSEVLHRVIKGITG